MNENNSIPLSKCGIDATSVEDDTITAARITKLKEHLQRKLPAVMIPNAFIILERMPRTSSGKIDRGALLQVEAKASKSRMHSKAPLSPIEQSLIGIWTDVLGAVEEVGIHSTFLDLGGHSLLQIQVNARVHSLFGVILPQEWLFEHPTIAHLASLIFQRLPPNRFEIPDNTGGVNPRP